VSQIVPKKEATWPWGSDRVMANGSSPGGSAVPPLRMMRSPSTCSAGQPVRLRSVRFLTLPSSRKVSRRSTAGGELRLGTVSIYMDFIYADLLRQINKKPPIYMGTFES